MYLTQGLHRCLQQTPERTATVFRTRRHTFRQLGDRVARLAGALRQRGMAEGDRVSMLALNSDRYIEYMLSVWWGGGVLNPVNTRWSVPEIVYSLDDCDTGILIVDDHFLPMVAGIVAGASRKPLLIHAGDGPAPDGMLSYEQLVADATPVDDALRGGDDLAAIMYTGGTTGKPKGVMQSHMNLWSSAISRMAQYPCPEDTITLHACPLFHTAAMAKAAYGLTEAAPVVSVNPPSNHGPEGRASGLYRSAGRPGYGVTVKIVDEQGVEVPRNVVGEIVVRGPNVMQGYWNKPGETADTLRGGWLHTGDGAYMDENGYLFIVDRLKDMIVSGGENVYSAEVENVLSRHPAVASCAVIGVPDSRWGEAVHAVIVLKPGAQVDEAGLREHCRQFIAGYKCPKSIEFRGEMPLSAAGKILKRDLRSPYWQDNTRQVN